MDGPPFSINKAEVKRHYVEAYQLHPVESKDVVGGFKRAATVETVWLLQRAKQVFFGNLRKEGKKFLVE